MCTSKNHHPEMITSIEETKDQKLVQHNYHDHARDNQSLTKSGNPRCRGGVSMPFPVKLHEMLDRIEEDGHADIVSWQPHGRCFIVRKPREFKELIPKYFKLSKMASFQRQLNLYGFTRLTRGRDKGGYYHEFFLRGKQFLLHNIHRIKVKGTGVRPRSNPNDEPHLWEMSWVGNANEEDSSSQCSSNISSQCSSNSSGNSSSSISSSTSPEIMVPNNSAALSSNSNDFKNLYSSSGMIEIHTNYKPVLAPPIVIRSEPLLNIAPQQTTTITPNIVYSTDKDDDDIIWSFGGKKFHYLDPYQFLESARRPVPSQEQLQNLTKVISEVEIKMTEICQDNNKNLTGSTSFDDLLEKVILNEFTIL